MTLRRGSQRAVRSQVGKRAIQDRRVFTADGDSLIVDRDAPNSKRKIHLALNLERRVENDDRAILVSDGEPALITVRAKADDSRRVVVDIRHVGALRSAVDRHDAAFFIARQNQIPSRPSHASEGGGPAVDLAGAVTVEIPENDLAVATARRQDAVFTPATSGHLADVPGEALTQHTSLRVPDADPRSVITGRQETTVEAPGQVPDPFLVPFEKCRDQTQCWPAELEVAPWIGGNSLAQTARQRTSVRGTCVVKPDRWVAI